MRLVVPDYFEQFKCLASECNDNCCCGGWQIDIDEETTAFYETVGGELGERLAAAVKKDDTCGCHFDLVDGQCPFLADSGLCQIQGELGAEHLGVVCSQFPRYTEYFGEVKERGLGLACEEAARLILTKTSPMQLVSSRIDEQVYEDSEFDYELFRSLERVRQVFLTEVNNESQSGKSVLIYMLCVADKMQEYINSDDWDRLSDYVNAIYGASCGKILTDDISDSDYAEAYSNLWADYEELESLGEAWDNCVELVREKVLGNCTQGRYARCFDRREYRNLMEYFIFRYFCKAAYDYDVIGAVRVTVANLMIIRDMEAALGDLSKAVHIFSRQIEYLEDGVNELKEAFMFNEYINTDVLTAIVAAD